MEYYSAILSISKEEWGSIMYNGTIEDKLTVFISSKIDDRYNIVRKALKRLLLETGMVVSVYAFETEGACSQNVKSALLVKIDTSYICVFLIYNKHKVPDAEMDDHERAKNANIHRLYFFCDEKVKTPTFLQNELMASGEVKYNDKVHEFSDLPIEAYKSVLQDIIDYYRGCKTMHDVSIKQSTSTKISANTLMFKKEIFKSYVTENELTKAFNPYISSNSESLKVSSDTYEALCSTLLLTLLGKNHFNRKNFLQLQFRILCDHDENIKSTIKERLEAVNCYFKGDLEGCCKKLNKAYKIAKDKSNIPQWLLNDIAIDIRNFNRMNDDLNNRLSSDRSSEKMLQDSFEIAYYPLLDRFEGNISSKLLVEFFEKHTESPYSWSSRNINFFIEDIASCFNISIRFGSLTHVLLTRKKYADILFTLFVQTNDVRLFVELIKMYLLLQNENQLKKVYTTYKQSVSAITAMDIDVLIASINTLSSEYQRSIAQLLLLEYFGYYFSEEQYSKQIQLFFNYAFSWCVDNKKIIDVGSYIIKTVKENIRRIDNQKAAELLVCFFDNHIGRYYREVLETAYLLDFSMINSNEHTHILNIFILLIEEKCFTDQDALRNAVIQFTLNTNKEKQQIIDETIKLNMPDFYNGEYDLEINKNNSARHILYYLDVAEQRNKDVSNKKYSGFAWNPFDIITNIIRIDKLKLSVDEIARIMTIVKETLLNTMQQADQKNSAILLLLFLKGTFPEFPSWNKLYKEINRKMEVVLSARSDHFFQTASQNTLLFNVILIKIGFRTCTHEEAAICFANVMSYCESDFINITKSLYSFLQIGLSKISRNVLGVIINFLLSIGSERHKDAQYYAAKSLILLSQDTTYGSIILERLVHLMNVSVSDIKLSILNSINNTAIHNSDIEDYILQKGRTDNHYLVRKIAEEITERKLNK